MKVELSIKDDKELRLHIREVIRGEITGAIRENIKAVVDEAIAKSSRMGNIDRLIADGVTRAVSGVVTSYSQNFNQMLAEAINKRLEVIPIQKMVEQKLAGLPTVTFRVGN